MGTFEKALKNPNSRKLVFTRLKLKAELFAWIEEGSAHPDVWYVDVSDIKDVLSITEDEADMAEVASLAALDVLDTSSVGGFFWDFDNDKVFVKPLSTSGTDIYTYLYVAIFLLAYSKHGGEYDSLPHDAVISKVPRMSLRTSEIFDGKVAQIGGGSVSFENADSLFVREDVEIDGKMEIVSILETLGGV